MSAIVLNKQEARLLALLMRKQQLTKEQAIKLLISKYAAIAAKEAQRCNN